MLPEKQEENTPFQPPEVSSAASFTGWRQDRRQVPADGTNTVRWMLVLMLSVRGCMGVAVLRTQSNSCHFVASQTTLICRNVTHDRPTIQFSS